MGSNDSSIASGLRIFPRLNEVLQNYCVHEVVLRGQLINFVVKHDPISMSQYGFIKHKSC